MELISPWLFFAQCWGVKGESKSYFLSRETFEYHSLDGEEGALILTGSATTR